jgi:predicted nucleic acid-binding protein
MIVVSNTSPLTNLAAIGRFDLFRLQYQRLHIAEGVWQELNFGGRRWPGSREVADADWIERHAVRNQELVRALRRDLDLGESETIALALELGSDLVLIDERQGRRAAQRHGLRTLGVVGMLIEAKARGQIDLLKPQLDALRAQAGFYLSKDFYQKALSLASE